MDLVCQLFFFYVSLWPQPRFLSKKEREALALERLALQRTGAFLRPSLNGVWGQGRALAAGPRWPQLWCTAAVEQGVRGGWDSASLGFHCRVDQLRVGSSSRTEPGCVASASAAVPGKVYWPLYWRDI
jgi:hypothetical protein